MAGLSCVGSVTGASGLASWRAADGLPAWLGVLLEHAARRAAKPGVAIPAIPARRRNSRRLRGRLRSLGCPSMPFLSASLARPDRTLPRTAPAREALARRALRLAAGHGATEVDLQPAARSRDPPDSRYLDSLLD